VTRIMYQDCYRTVYRYFTKSSPLPTYFTVRSECFPGGAKIIVTPQTAEVVFAGGGGIAWYGRRGGIFNIHLTANLPRNLPAIFLNRLRSDRIMVMSRWPRYFGTPRILLRSFSRRRGGGLAWYPIRSD